MIKYIKSVILGLILLPSFSLLGQNNFQDISKENIGTMLIGTWKLKGTDTDTKFVFSSSENEQILCKVYQSLEQNETATELVHETEVQIIEDTNTYHLKWDYPLFFWKGEIEKIKSQQLLVAINGKTLKFAKERN